MEIWKAIPSSNGFYAASNLGRIRREVGGSGARAGVILKTSTDQIGRLFVVLGKPHHHGKNTRRRVHRLVLEAFVGDAPDGCECRHLNGNPKDNRLENLAWGTHKENMDDKIAHGTLLAGERHGSAKLTNAQVVEIRSALANGEQGRVVAARYGVGDNVVSRIKCGHRWRSVT